MIRRIFIFSVFSLGLVIFVDYKLHESNHIQIQIHGNIKNPGIYKMPIGSRLYDAIRLSGGFNDDYKLDLRRINLSVLLKDGENIFIENQNAEQDVKSNYQEKNNFTYQQKMININTASISELDSLPGIGRNTAQKIINSRPFESIEDIKRVSGIGDKKFEQIKNLISVN